MVRFDLDLSAPTPTPPAPPARSDLPLPAPEPADDDDAAEPPPLLLLCVLSVAGVRCQRSSTGRGSSSPSEKPTCTSKKTTGALLEANET